MPLNPLKALKVVAPHARENYLEAVGQGNPLFEQHGINTPQRMAHFLAQAMQETGAFTVLRENMNYSAPRLFEIFGVGHHSAKITKAEALILEHHPETIAERVYGLGNPKKAKELATRMRETALPIVETVFSKRRVAEVIAGWETHAESTSKATPIL